MMDGLDDPKQKMMVIGGAMIAVLIVGFVLVWIVR
jgi:hypothetical protein